MSFNSKYFDRKAGSLEEAILKTVQGEAFKPHMMYDPKTGKGYKADTMDDHLRMKKMGYGHEAPKNESNLDEAKFSPQEIKMAIGIASDKRYAGGNMTGAVKAIEKMKKGLSDHPQVRAVLKRQNEENLDELSAAQKKLPPALQKAIKAKEGKKEDVSVKEKLVGGQKKLDKDKDGDIDGKDFAMLRKSKSKSEAFEYGTPEATQNSLNMTPGQSTADWNETVSVIQKKNDTMREALAKVWGFEEGHNPFRKEEKVPKGFHRMPDGSLMKDSDMDKKENKTMTGKPMTKVDVDPDVKEKRQS